MYLLIFSSYPSCSLGCQILRAIVFKYNTASYYSVSFHMHSSECSHLICVSKQQFHPNASMLLKAMFPKRLTCLSFISNIPLSALVSIEKLTCITVDFRSTFPTSYSRSKSKNKENCPSLISICPMNTCLHEEC